MYVITYDTKYVDKHTRAGQSGKEIICPVCFKERTVYHFAWSFLGCSGHMVEKPAWIIK